MTEFVNTDTPLVKNADADQLVKHDLSKLEVRKFEPCRRLHYVSLIRVRVSQTESTSMSHKLVEIFSYPLYKTAHTRKVGLYLCIIGIFPGQDIHRGQQRVETARSIMASS